MLMKKNWCLILRIFDINRMMEHEIEDDIDQLLFGTNKKR